jgi:hypothetical protein
MDPGGRERPEEFLPLLADLPKSVIIRQTSSFPIPDDQPGFCEEQVGKVATAESHETDCPHTLNNDDIFKLMNEDDCTNTAKEALDITDMENLAAAAYEPIKPCLDVFTESPSPVLDLHPVRPPNVDPANVPTRELSPDPATNAFNSTQAQSQRTNQTAKPNREVAKSEEQTDVLVQEGTVADSGYVSACAVIPINGPKPHERLREHDTIKQPHSVTEDQQTVYTSLVLPRRSDYINDLCSEIYMKLKDEFQKDTNDQDRIELPRYLPDLIKAFSIRIGLDPSEPSRTYIMHFIHMHHRYAWQIYMQI